MTSDTDTHFIVQMRVYAFDTKEDAKAYMRALSDAFTAMPESAEYGATVHVLEEPNDQ